MTRASTLIRHLIQRVTRATAVINRIIGAPDYEGYLRHHQACHPGCPPMSRDEFVRQRLDDRYARPGARCC